jgi:hypothetical protein
MTPDQKQAAIERMWLIRRLLRTGDVDPFAATVSLEIIAMHGTPAMRRLAADTLAEISPMRGSAA